MSKLYILLGKSSSGKDTIYSGLLKKAKLSPLVGYTTRPIREGESEGKEYHFVTTQKFQELKAAGKVIESRTYHTVHGDWSYFTVDDGQIDWESKDYLYIGTLESYNKIVEYYGSEKVYPIYIEVENGLRLERALGRERKQKEPKYAEMCRRFLADEDDFSEDKIQAAGITKRYYNTNLKKCIEAINRKIM